jgi:hypothetical protein
MRILSAKFCEAKLDWLVGRNPASKINFYSNGNTPRKLRGVFITIFDAAMNNRHCAAVIRW